MKCPCCNRELFEGYIYNSSNPVQWIPNGKKPPRIVFRETEAGVSLKNKFDLFKIGTYHAEAYYCEACHLVIAPTE